MYQLLRKILFLFEPETAHRFTLILLKLVKSLHLTWLYPSVAEAPREVMGLTFKNPVGFAAGFDKNAEAFVAAGALGIGFIEIGTVTPKPQRGNPKPRVFRLNEDEAIINRLGFNSIGLEQFLRNIKDKQFPGVLGISVTQNNDTPYENAIADYVLCYEKVYTYADYVAINISCPNVPGKKTLETTEKFGELLQRLKEKQSQLTNQLGKYVPMAIKISPDLTEADLEKIARDIRAHQLDAVIATNTTTSRPVQLASSNQKEKGGLSGPPLFPLTLKTVKQLHSVLGDEVPIIALGGIDSAQAAQQLFAAGASLVQIYTGFIYHGPKLIQDIVSSIGFKSTVIPRLDRRIHKSNQSVDPAVKPRDDE